jgi:hypothetical protein
VSTEVVCASRHQRRIRLHEKLLRVADAPPRMPSLAHDLLWTSETRVLIITSWLVLA